MAIKVYGFPTQNNGCGKYRIWEPLAALARSGLAEVDREPDEPQPISIERCDSIFRQNDVIFCQPFSEIWAACIFAAARDEHKKKLIVDLDDNVWAVHSMNIGPIKGQLTSLRSHFHGEFTDYWELLDIKESEIDLYGKRIDGTVVREASGKVKFLKNKHPDVKTAVEFVLQVADAVTTTNETLAAVIRQHTDKPVYVLPNCLDLRQWKKAKVNSIPWVGWYGSVSHYPDVKLPLRGLDSLMKKRSDLNVQIMGSSFDYLFPLKPGSKTLPVAGYGPTDSMFYSDYKNCGERWPGRMSFSKPVPVQEFNEWITSEWKSQIGLAPILNNDFNDSKSELKWLEYTALGVPVVASNCGPYKRTIKNGIDGLLVDVADFWAPAIASLLDDSKKRARLVEAATDRLHHDYDIDKKVNNWLEVFACADCLAA